MAKSLQFWMSGVNIETIINILDKVDSLVS